MSRRLRKLAVVGTVAAIVLWLASSAAVAWTLTHRKRAPFAEPVPAWGAGRMEEIRLETVDDQHLGAWFVPAASSPSTSARTAVILLHGNSGSRTSQAAIVRWLADRGVAVLAPSLRAHGDSSCDENDVGWSARLDVEACVAFLERRVPGARIVVVGTSLGAVAAIYAAPELDHRVSAYVLESPYRDLRSAVRHRLRHFLPVPLDEVAYAGLCFWSHFLLEPDVDDLSPIDRIAAMPRDVPVVFLSGNEDFYAPLAEVEEIRARCPGAARLVRFPGAGHFGGLAAADPERYRGVLLDVLAAR